MKIIDIIDRFISGDWGEESYSEVSPCKVSCIRGADFVPIEHHDFSHVPTRYISKQSFEKKCLQVGDIIVEKSGGSPTQSTGRLSFISKDFIDSAGDIVCTNFCVAFRVKKGWNPLYVFYYLQHIYNNGVFFNFEGKTSGLRNLNLDAAFNAIPIEEIGVREQEDAVSILDNISRKIIFNRQINQNLEALAKQLYDYWFVQFDFPDENGRPYKSSGGKMVWNETLKRNVPSQWDVDNLGNHLSLLKDGTHNPPKRTEYGVPLLTGTMFGNYFLNYTKATYITKEDYKAIHSQYQPQEGDIILTKIGTLGNVNYLRNNDIPIAIHCNSALLRFPLQWGKIYPFFLCKSPLFKARLKALKGQSIQEFASLERISSIQIEIPNINVVNKFNMIVNPIFKELISNTNQIEQLTKQRNELLPLLMNGQVSLNSDLSLD